MCVCVCIRLIRHLWLVTLWSEYFYFIAYHRQRKRYVNLPVYTHIFIYTYKYKEYVPEVAGGVTV